MVAWPRATPLLRWGEGETITPVPFAWTQAWNYTTHLSHLLEHNLLSMKLQDTYISAQVKNLLGKHPKLQWICNLNAQKRHRDAGAGIAQWLEHRTRDWKVTGSNPCWNGGRIFFSRVDFLCWLLFRYPFHPRVTAVARKKSRSCCQKRCRWQVTAKHAYTLRMWILLNRASALVTTCP